MLGWLLPDGVFYECEFMGHESRAKELLLEVYGVDTEFTQRLADLGWCALRSGFVGFPENPYRDTPLFTGAQKAWLHLHRDDLSYAQAMSLDDSLSIDAMLREENGGHWEKPKL